MKIKLQDYSLISNELLKALIGDIEFYKKDGQIIPSEKLAQKVWRESQYCESELMSEDDYFKEKEEFLTSEIDI